jgi:hypothetical protein
MLLLPIRVAFDEQHKYVACLNETLIGSNNVAE